MSVSGFPRDRRVMLAAVIVMSQKALTAG